MMFSWRFSLSLSGEIYRSDKSKYINYNLATSYYPHVMGYGHPTPDLSSEVKSKVSKFIDCRHTTEINLYSLTGPLGNPFTSCYEGGRRVSTLGVIMYRTFRLTYLFPFPFKNLVKTDGDKSKSGGTPGVYPRVYDSSSGV